MDGKYCLNDLALMTGFTTRTLRNYMAQGLLNGEKTNGMWQFTTEEIERFCQEPFVKEGLRIKRNSVVFDFMAGIHKSEERSCVILDIPASMERFNKISAFFCDKMNDVEDILFNSGWDKGICRVILSGNADSVAYIIRSYYSAELDD